MIVTLHEFGVVRSDGNIQVDSTACDEIGEEFNPLSELDENGFANPYQDPNYGRPP